MEGITLGPFAQEDGLPAAVVDGIYRRALMPLGSRLVVYAARVTPVRTGRLRRGWYYHVSARSVSLRNDVDYMRPVNDGHVLRRGGRVVGYVPGRHMIARAIAAAQMHEVAAARRMVAAALAREQKKRRIALAKAALERALARFRMLMRMPGRTQEVLALLRQIRALRERLRELTR